MGRPRFAHPFKRNAQGVAALIMRTPRLEKPCLLLLRTINRDADGDERITADIELGVRQRPERGGELFKLHLEQSVWRGHPQGRKQADFQRSLLE